MNGTEILLPNLIETAPTWQLSHEWMIFFIIMVYILFFGLLALFVKITTKRLRDTPKSTTEKRCNRKLGP